MSYKVEEVSETYAMITAPYGYSPFRVESGAKDDKGNMTMRVVMDTPFARDVVAGLRLLEMQRETLRMLIPNTVSGDPSRK